MKPLADDLAELEASDPEVAAAAKRLDELPEQLDAMHQAIAFRERLRAKTKHCRTTDLDPETQAAGADALADFGRWLHILALTDGICVGCAEVLIELLEGK